MPEPVGSAPPVRQPNHWLWWAKLVFRGLVFAAVVGGIVYSVGRSLDEFQKQDFSLADVNAWWLVASGGIYLAGLVPWWLFWHQTLRALGQQPTLWESFVAYFISQLGKYMPGKALVIVVRTDFVRSSRVDTTVAATSVFVETLTMMAVGALLSAIILMVLFHDQWKLVLLALGMMLCVGVPTIPPLFRRIVRLLQVQRANPKIDEALRGLDYRLILTGWPGLVLGWCLLGLSLWATLRAMPGAHAPPADLLHTLPALTAFLALAMVAGFLTPLPGGLGVRELVAGVLLAPLVGQVEAIVSVVLLRFTWLLAEIIISTILYLVTLVNRPRSPDP